MTFLSPLFFLGALALAVPIVVHLVHKEKSRRIPFASLMFMPRLPVKQMSQRRLKHLFLLFLRCLGLLLLVAAFARPVITSAWFGNLNPVAARSVLILVDNSLSMSRQSVWSAALRAVEERIDSLRDFDEALLVQFAEGGQVLNRWQSSKERLRELARQQLKPSFESTSYLEALRLAVDQFEDASNPDHEIHLVTDLQRTGLGSTRGWKVPEGLVVEIEDVGIDSSNLYIDEVRVERDVFTKDYPHALLARVVRRPAGPLKGEAQLLVEGQMVDRQTFELNDQGTAQITLGPFSLEEGVSRGKIVLAPEDEVAADNVFHFVAERREPQKVVVVSGSRGAASSFYLQRALLAGENLPFSVEVSSRLPNRVEAPSEVPLYIFDNLQRFPSATEYARYLEQGGGLIVVLGSRRETPRLDSNWKDLLPALPLERRFVRSRSNPFTSITQVSWEHPAFEVFQDLHKSSITSTQFYGYWTLDPNPSATVLARFAEGDPALLERSQGRGRLLLFASSLDSAWTDFPLRSAYLPFWHQVTRYASGWRPAPAALRVNQTLARHADSREGVWNVIDPTGKRVHSLQESESDSIQLKIPGHYEIRENKGTDWVAANTLPLESDLSRVPVEDLQAVFIPRQSRSQRMAEEGEIAASTEKQQSLWWLFLVAAGLLWIVESVVANRTRTDGAAANTGQAPAPVETG